MPTQITINERAAKRLEKYANLFPSERGDDGFYIIPSDKRALRKHRKKLQDLLSEYQDNPIDESILNKIRNIDLLLPHIDTLISCHDELEKLTGIVNIDPDANESTDVCGKKQSRISRFFSSHR